MSAKITSEHIEKIKKILDEGGRKEAVVKEENGEVVILKSQRTKV